jgi:hypothetical protein
LPFFAHFVCLFSLSPATVTSRQIVDQKIELKVESKVGSLANIKHRPGGGDKKVFNDVEYLRQTSSTLHSSNVSRTSSRRESTSQVKASAATKKSAFTPTRAWVDGILKTSCELLKIVLTLALPRNV